METESCFSRGRRWGDGGKTAAGETRAWFAGAHVVRTVRHAASAFSARSSAPLCGKKFDSDRYACCGGGGDEGWGRRGGRERSEARGDLSCSLIIIEKNQDTEKSKARLGGLRELPPPLEGLPRLQR